MSVLPFERSTQSACHAARESRPGYVFHDAAHASGHSILSAPACKADWRRRKVRVFAARLARFAMLAVWAASAASLPQIASAASASARLDAAARNAAGATPAAPSARPDTRVREMTFTRMGVDYAIRLRGTQGLVGIPFSVRTDELVTQASLRLRYAYSPQLIPALSSLKVLVNDVLVGTLPVVAGAGGQPQETVLPVDHRLIGEFNRIHIELIGHYTQDCEDPGHSSLWATVDPSSTLTLTTASLRLPEELGGLPEPFFDRRDVGRLTLPFVLPADNSPPMLEAAGILASWFGALADYRGAVFPALRGKLPDAPGHTVVFALPDTAIPGVPLPQVEGPTLTILAHPLDATRKLLVVSGRNPAELRTAASALALNSRALKGRSALITDFTPAPARLPYDAPKWMASDRAVKLGELAQTSGFSVQGYAPDVIRVNLRLPPDLFAWRSRGIPLELRYSYTPRQRPDQSSLNINVNDLFVGHLPLRAARPADDRWYNLLALKFSPDGQVQEQRTLLLPSAEVGSHSQLRLHYYFEPAATRCMPLVANVAGRVDPDSTIDVSKLPHYIAMPDLAAFATSGFPFSRLADLAQTTVVLPDQALLSDVQLYLGLLGQIGRATGFPALRVAVEPASTAMQGVDRDLLVIGDMNRQPLFALWREQMPLREEQGARTWSLPAWAEETYALVTGVRRRPDLAPTTRMSVRDDGSDAVLAGFESPTHPGRSVLAAVAGPDAQGALMEALLDPTKVRRIQGSTAIVREGQVHSLLAASTYYVGRLPPFEWLQWQLSRSPLPLIGFAAVLAFLGAGIAYVLLRRRAGERLN